MRWRHCGRLSFVCVAALVVGTLAAPVGVGAADAAHRIIADTRPGGPTVDLLIGARPGRSGEVAKLTAGFGGRDKGAVRGLAVRRLRIPAEAAAALERTLETDPSVGYVEVDATAHATLEPDDPFYGPSTEWGLALIGAPAAWDTSTGGDGPILAVVDTGVDATHPDLEGRVLPGIDLVNGDNDASDDNGHGTHVAGIMAATGNNGIGGAGVCWGCRILPVKALNAAGSGAYSTLASGITWAADHGARVINLSLGGPSDSVTLRAAVTYARSHGAIVVAAAGNNGVTSRFYPAGIDEVIAVGAADSSDDRYDFSDFGTDWVDVAAPGCTESTWPGGGYESLCGTSMATPFVTGSLGLLMAAAPGATSAEVEAALDGTAGPEGTTWTTHGAIHLDHALATLLTSGPYPTPTPDPTPTPTPTPIPTPKPVAAPSVATRSASLSVVPRTLTIVALTGSGKISLSNPRHLSLVVTLRRAGRTIWRGATRSGIVRWAIHLQTATYTLTVTRAGSRSAKGTIGITYHRR